MKAFLLPLTNKTFGVIIEKPFYHFLHMVWKFQLRLEEIISFVFTV